MRHLVISGSCNIYPKEVEDLSGALPGVLESAVIGLPHANPGEGVTAIVVLRSGAALDPDTIRDALSDRLARFKQPRRVISSTACRAIS